MSVEKFIENFKDCEKPPYSMLLNKAIQNIKDPVTLAIWVYLSSMPSDWTINRKQIMNHFNIGEKKIKVVMASLHKMNLLQYVQEKEKTGRFGNTSARILCGDNFVPLKITVGAEIAPTEPVGQLTAGSICARAVNAVHTNKDTYKENKETNIVTFEKKVTLFPDEDLGKERWEEFSEPFEKKAKTGDCEYKLKKLSKSDYELLLKQRDAYMAVIKQNRKEWSDYPMKNASTFLTPKYWRDADWSESKIIKPQTKQYLSAWE